MVLNNSEEPLWADQKSTILNLNAMKNEDVKPPNSLAPPATNTTHISGLPLLEINGNYW